MSAQLSVVPFFVSGLTMLTSIIHYAEFCMLGIAAYSFVIDNWDIGCLCKSVLRILSVYDLQQSLVVFSHGLFPQNCA